MRKILCFVFAAMLTVGAALTARGVSADEDYLARAIAASYPEVSFGARVAIAAVAVNRTKATGYPDSYAGAVASLAAEGEFGGIIKLSAEIDEGLLRLSRDAVSAAVSGADPTHGALHFWMMEEDGGADLRFDDTREDEAERRIRREISEIAGVGGGIIDGVGVY